MVTRGERWGRDKLGVWDYQIQITMYKIDKQQGPTVYYIQYPVITIKKIYAPLLVAVWPWASDLTSLSIDFFSEKWGSHHCKAIILQ